MWGKGGNLKVYNKNINIYKNPNGNVQLKRYIQYLQMMVSKRPPQKLTMAERLVLRSKNI